MNELSAIESQGQLPWLPGLKNEDEPKVTSEAVYHHGNGQTIQIHNQNTPNKNTHDGWGSELSFMNNSVANPQVLMWPVFEVCLMCLVLMGMQSVRWWCLCMYSRSWSKCVCRPSAPGTEHTIRAFWKVLHLLTKLLCPPMSFYTDRK